MAEVEIKAHTRRTKNGKVVKVNSYTRRVGRKGIRSPKKSKTVSPGEEFEKKAEAASQPLSQEELRKRIEVTKGFERAEKERKRLGISREEYSRRKLKEYNYKLKNPTSVNSEVKSADKKAKDIFSKVESAMAKFVGK